ncbi:hypothetical protein ACFLYU_00855 [Candidatus Dependentiae bacterium]
MKSIIKKSVTLTISLSTLFVAQISLGAIGLQTETGKKLVSANKYTVKLHNELKEKKFKTSDMHEKLDMLSKYVRQARSSALKEEITKHEKTYMGEGIFTNLYDSVSMLKDQVLLPKIDKNQEEKLTAFYKKWYEKRKKKLESKELKSFDPEYINKLKTLNNNIFILTKSILQKRTKQKTQVKKPEPGDFKEIYKNMDSEELGEKISKNVRSWWMIQDKMSEQKAGEKQEFKNAMNKLQERLDFARPLFKKKLEQEFKTMSKKDLEEKIKTNKDKYYKFKAELKDANTTSEKKYWKDKMKNTQTKLDIARKILKKK